MDGGENFVLFKDYQVDPVTRRLLHADFLEVKLDEPVKVEVPVSIVGKAVGTAEGGILSVATHDIAVKALPTKIPLKIEVDVTELKIGASIHISELKAPEGCSLRLPVRHRHRLRGHPREGGGRRGGGGGSWRGGRGGSGAGAPGGSGRGRVPRCGSGAAGAAPAAGAKGAAPAAAPAAKGGEKKK